MKSGAIECELHETISLVSRGVKVLLKMIMMRTRNKIRPEIGEKQFGFVQDAEDLYVCFIDYPKEFGKMKREEHFNILEGLDLDRKNIRVINLNWEQAACMRMGYETRENTIQGLVIGGHNIINLRYANDTIKCRVRRKTRALGQSSIRKQKKRAINKLQRLNVWLLARRIVRYAECKLINYLAFVCLSACVHACVCARSI